MFISLLQKIVRPMFGEFEIEEFKKFLRLGLVFSCILGSYWSIRVLKSPIFVELVDKQQIPWAKTASILCLIPIVMIYTKLLDKMTHAKMFYRIAALYGITTIIFGLLFMSTSIGQAPREIIELRQGFALYATKVLGYAWYVFVESYGSLVIALFWAITSSTTMPESAKKGYSLIVAIGQMGGIFSPYLISQLPGRYGHETSSLALFLCSILMFALIYLMGYFYKATPHHLMTSFHGKNEEVIEQKQEPGFLEGLQLLLKHKYMLSIFAVTCIYEIIITIFDFHFTTMAATQYSGRAFDTYYGFYGSSVNLVALACLLLGINNITRILGVGFALLLMPCIFAVALFGFTTLNSLNFLFSLMVASKAINYALNGPAIKQLYIPTTPDVRYKTQAWIEAFGSRSSKAAGSGFNMLYGPLQKQLGELAGRARHVALSSYLGFSLVFVWFFIAWYLGKKYKHAIDNKNVVC
jgi:AAA family ATP:ADP antiporter